MNRSAGYSIVTVLMATAIASVMLVAILFIVDIVSTTIARNTAVDNIEAAMRTIQGIVANRDLCDNALRLNSPVQKVPFLPNDPPATPPTEAPINRIYLQRSDGEAGATIVLSRGGTIGPGYTVQNIALRERNQGNGRGQIALEGVNMRTYAAEIVIDIRGGPGMKRRTIPYNVVVHPTGDVVHRCYQDSSVEFLCEQLGGTYQGGTCQGILSETESDCLTLLRAEGPPPAGNDCPADPPLSEGLQCDNVYYVAGFSIDGPDINSKPICRCQKVCRTGTSNIGGSVATPSGPGPTSPSGPVATPGPGTSVGTSGGN